MNRLPSFLFLLHCHRIVILLILETNIMGYNAVSYIHQQFIVFDNRRRLNNETSSIIISQSAGSECLFLPKPVKAEKFISVDIGEETMEQQENAKSVMEHR